LLKRNLNLKFKETADVKDVAELEHILENLDFADFVLES